MVALCTRLCGVTYTYMTRTCFNLCACSILLLLLCFGGVVTRNAWLSDDAYITFRTVDNFINGYGLTWNVSERVQAYTHPLWMFLLSAVYFFTREIFFSSHVLCIVVSLLAAYVLASRVAGSPIAALWGLTVLTLSKAFVDYSTSGLENPLTHLILAVFLALYLGAEANLKTLFFLSLLAALGMLNRMDTALLFLPALAYSLARPRQAGVMRRLYTVALGFTPLVVWEMFSLFYYGALVPNTAFAKLNLGLIGRRELLPHGLYYVLDSMKRDPLTLTVIAASIVVPYIAEGKRSGPSATKAWHALWHRSEAKRPLCYRREAKRLLPVVAGCLLYILYLVSIGGDFMSGRFLSAPLLAAVAVLISLPHDAEGKRSGSLNVEGKRSGSLPPAGGGDREGGLPRAAWLAPFALVLILGLFGPNSPVLTAPENRAEFDPGSWISSYGISDEGANYYPNTGLVVALQGAHLPDHDWALEGRAARQGGPTVVERGSVGFFGYFAGPQVYVIDLLGLTNPLLARLPPTSRNWRVGHFGRTVPDGYVETLTCGENRIEDRNLAAYYDRLAFVIQGDLFDPHRLVEIWRLNVGAYDRYLEAYAYSRGQAFTQHLQVINPTSRPYVYAYVWNNGAAEAFLLDSASQRGDVYTINWTIAADGVQFEGPYERQVASINALSDGETLNVGVYFSQQPDTPPYDMFERRFWFRIEDDHRFTVVLPGREWHNSDAPQGAWLREDIEGVLREAPMRCELSMSEEPVPERPLTPTSAFPPHTQYATRNTSTYCLPSQYSELGAASLPFYHVGTGLQRAALELEKEQDR